MLRHLLLFIVLSSAVRSDESSELLSSAAKVICGSATTNLDQSCMEKVVANFFERFNWCFGARTACFVCKTANQNELGRNLFSFKGAKTHIDIADFAKVSLALFTVIHDVTPLCKTNTVPNKPYSEYWTDLSGEAEFKADKAEWLEHAFKAIGSSFDTSKNGKCITNTAIVSESEATSQKTDEEWAKRSTLFAVLHILNGFQLDTTCTSVPDAASIWKNLLQRLGLSSTASHVTEKAMTKLFKELEIESTAAATTTADHHGHNHRRKRSIEEHQRYRRAIATVATNVSQCLTVDQMFHVYGVDESVGATSTQFEKLCPAILEQKLSASCQKKSAPTTVTSAQSYGFGTLAVFLISCGALLGAVLVPCIKYSSFDLVMLFFIAMAVGTLITDSLLHLVPEAIGLHNHAAHQTTSFTPPEPYFWKMFLLICMLYVLYLLEVGISFAKGTHQVDNHDHSHDENNVSLHGHTHLSMDAFTNSDTEKNETDKVPSDEKYDAPNIDDHSITSKVRNTYMTAIIVLVGDFVHNFADGLAIGAAFAAGLSSGLSTSIAIMCHELPHEIGDFVVLLSANISVKRALLFNFLSALSAFVGLYIGIPISGNESVRQWIFAITAALFLYIALANMLPSIRTACPSSKIKSFSAQALGLGLGIFLIFLLGLFESLIHL